MKEYAFFLFFYKNRIKITKNDAFLSKNEKNMGYYALISAVSLDTTRVSLLN